ncbi:alpha-1A adrenergic receptor-like [Hydractinia symbiolongicarpus]|uniref:alpha-1A adrenergic receptor-like n=1 Tax=Hydractinia symbiolongicarpus TaxID=13093 RepID=UPI00254C2147|nr:alpha-1A adrenergic receptor-like [Hydractinia symbiolongicarpus]
MLLLLLKQENRIKSTTIEYHLLVLTTTTKIGKLQKKEALKMGDTTCNTFINLLTSPVTDVFGVLFLLLAVGVCAGNSMILFILRHDVLQMKYNRLLQSLAVSDFLVGCVLSPLTGIQVLKRSFQCNLLFDTVRRYFTILLVGTSVITVGIISYDRYILLKRSKNYDQYMTTRKLYILVAFAWLFPALTPFIRYAGVYPYYAVVILLVVGPLFTLLVSYYFLSSVVKKKERSVNDLRKSVIEEFGSSIAVRLSSTRQENEITVDNHSNTLHPIDKIKACRHEKKYVKTVKAVTTLITCYFICIVPILICLVLMMVNDKTKYADEKDLQIVYYVACFTSQINSCINPIIYFARIPKIRREIQKLFRHKKMPS